jgi:hypothetical protein
LLAREEPDTALDIDDEQPADIAGTRTRGWGRGAHPDDEIGLAALADGIDGGAATALEAAIHAVDDDDYDIRCGD